MNAQFGIEQLFLFSAISFQACAHFSACLQCIVLRLLLLFNCRLLRMHGTDFYASKHHFVRNYDRFLWHTRRTFVSWIFCPSIFEWRTLLSQLAQIFRFFSQRIINPTRDNETLKSITSNRQPKNEILENTYEFIYLFSSINWISNTFFHVKTITSIDLLNHFLFFFSSKFNPILS